MHFFQDHRKRLKAIINTVNDKLMNEYAMLLLIVVWKMTMITIITITIKIKGR